jgi:hypothetical protein
VIIRGQGGELLLFKQLDHARLAGDFSAAWGGSFETPGPAASVHLAAARHDEGWRELDEEPLFDVEKRRPLNFLDMEFAGHAEMYARGIHRIIDLDPYAGLLVSMHGAGLYTGRWGYQPGIRMTRFRPESQLVIDRFVAEQEGLQAELKIQLWDREERRGDFERRLWATYELIQVWCRLSLYLCMSDLHRPDARQVGMVPRRLAGLADTEVTVGSSPGSGVVVVDPYPFKPETVEASVAYVAIPDRDYASVNEVRSALADGRRGVISARFAGKQSVLVASDN